MSHTLYVTTQLSPKQGGANGKVLVIDTERAFRPERLASIAEMYLCTICKTDAIEHREQQYNTMETLAAAVKAWWAVKKPCHFS